MPLKNLFLIILITILLAALAQTAFTKITGYMSIVIYGTVVSPSPDSPAAQEQGSSTLTGTVTQPQKEETTQPTAVTQTTSSTVKPQEQKQYINQTILLQLINQTENLQIKLDKLRTSSRNVLNYYSSINDTKNTEKWINIVTLFNQVLDDMGDIQNYTENAKNSATREDVSIIKDMIADVLKTLDKIVKLIKN